MEENKKIIIATGIFPPDIGGPATYSEKLAKELKKKNFDVQIITYSDSGKKCESYDFPLTTVSRRYPQGLRHFLYFWRLIKLIKDADIVYAQCLISSGLPACLAAKYFKKKFILKIVGDYAWEQGGVRWGIKDSLEIFQIKKDYPWQVKFLKFLERWVAKNASVIITPSNYLKSIIEGWKIDPEKIHPVKSPSCGELAEGELFNRVKVIYNSFDGLNFSCDLSKEDAQNKINIKGDILLSVGRLVPWKGFDTLIKIMPELLTRNIRFKLVIVGSGPDEEKLKNLIDALNLKNYVILAGQIDHKDLPCYFKASDLFALNTNYEGLSHILLEAMHFNLPIITTNIGGNPEIIEHNHNGLLVEYNNRKELKKSVIDLWENEELQKKFQENSKKVLEKFTFEQMIEDTLKILFK